ncbi:MAG TPA: thiamine pyrophosphate-dependent enzyme [Bacillales bacterium]|nr:thiamine pyrophosphate-dependent enzyme [Bacillales bacterium]
MMTRLEALQTLFPYTENLPVISACGATSREWASLGKRPNHLYNVDTMGLSPSIALGVSLALSNSPIPKCIVLEGDGGVLMNPNVLTSSSFLKAEKWILVILDNGCFDSTGGQRSMASKINVGDVAKGYGLSVLTAEEKSTFERAIQTALAEKGHPIVIHAKVKPGNIPAPYLNEDPVVAAYEFTRFIQEAANRW